MNARFLSLCSLLLLAQSGWALTADLKAYGAKGDGVTDDTAAIARASHAVASVGGMLLVPPGTFLINPAKGHLELGSNMTVSGPGTIKVKPGSGQFDYVIGPVPNYRVISNVTIHGITVDENVYSNTSTVTHTVGEMQNILAAYEGRYITLTSVHFVLSGVYAVVVADHLTMEYSSIQFEKRSTNPWFDNSSIYIPTQHSTCLIENNSWVGSTGANTAIEVHYTDNCVIAGNHFDNYVTAVLPMDTNKITITGNTVTRGQYAVSLWSQSLLQNATISNNTISLNNKDRQSQAASGVALYWCSYCSPVGSFRNIAITGNNISFQPEVRTNLAASSYWGIGVMPAGNVSGVSITGNTIVNAPIRAIKIGNPFKSNWISGVTVENNTIISAGNNTALWWYEAAIALEGHLSAVTVKGNKIVSQQPHFVGHYALWSNPAGVYSSVSTAGNTIQPTYASSLSSTIAK